MRHPIEKYNQEQAKTLADLPADQREFWARQFRLGNATYCYQAQFKAFSGQQEETALDWLERLLAGTPDPQNRTANELLMVYFEEWLEGLPTDRLRQIQREEGLDKAKKSYPFRRYVLERNDLGMDDFLKKNLSPEDYHDQLELGKSINNG